MRGRASGVAAAFVGLVLSGCPKAPPQGGKAQASSAATSAVPPPATVVSSAASATAAAAASTPAPASTVPVKGSSGRVCVGGGHSCFVDREHTLWCWGGNTYGQVGVGTHGFGGRTENTDLEHDVVARPSRVASLERKVGSIHCGTQQTCAVLLDGTVQCWGMGENPKRTEIFSDVPVPRPFGRKVIRLALQSDHACAILEDHTLWCWGANHRGQLGAGPPPPGSGPNYATAAPFAALGSSVAGTVVLEEATCASKNDDTLWCWGTNDEGELGNGTYEKHLEPVRAINPERFRLVASSAHHACGVTLDERLLCWGRNYEGQLGNGQAPRTKPVNSPTAVPVVTPFAGIRALALGNASTLVVLENGELYAWGDLTLGMRGFNPEPRSVPQWFQMPGPVVEIAANATHRCALLADESLWCWGRGEGYELGDGKAENRDKPVRVVFSN